MFLRESNWFHESPEINFMAQFTGNFISFIELLSLKLTPKIKFDHLFL